MSSLRAWAGQGRLYCLRPSCVGIRHYTVNVAENTHDGNLKRAYRPGKKGHVISTLNPSFIKATDYLDLSNKQSLLPRLPGATSLDKTPLRSVVYSQVDKGPSGGYIPFPAGTRGFFYYHHPPDALLIEGSLRFRVTSDDAPTSFPRGQDLLAPSGMPWQVALGQIVMYPRYRWIADQLLHDNLVTEEQLSRCRKVFANLGRIDPGFLLFRFDSEVIVDFSHYVYGHVVGEALHRFQLCQMFADLAGGGRRYPWTGSAIACFEPSALPEYAGRRVVHMRIVKILQPVECTLKGYKGRVLRPEEGQLFTVMSYGGPPKPWAYDIDRYRNKISLAFQVLWENSQTPRS